MLWVAGGNPRPPALSDNPDGGVNNLACKNLFAKLNSKAKLKQSHVSLSLLNDDRKDEWLLLRAGGTR